tara:strand:- start:488 stop:766 length:279 start_codon:yes stop_codon:yes gene_type:complete
MTPYIFDDRADFREIADAIKYWYDIPKDDRRIMGMEGHDWVCGDESYMSAKGMSMKMSGCIETCFEKWSPRKRFTLYKVDKLKQIETTGVIV